MNCKPDGDFEEVRYTFDFPDQEAYNSGNYTDKDWFMNDGSRGPFTYNPETHIVEITITERYIKRESAAALFFAEDYNWVPYRTSTLGYNAPQGDTATNTNETVMYFNNDTPMVSPCRMQGEESNAWKEGNTVTFLLEQTKHEVIWYLGETAPDPPSVDPVTGEGDNTDTTYSYKIYLDKSNSKLDMQTFTFMHQGEVILFTDQLINSYRGVR